MREYQRDITRTALYNNTLVSLPTGLGKTLIAAVVMYNFRRWFPKGKIVFCAPTRPLVTQQISACYNIMGIPVADTAEITGSTAKNSRAGLWESRSMFFTTPQTLLRDIEAGRCKAWEIVCIVLDEAHKARGDYAYVKVVDAIKNSSRPFHNPEDPTEGGGERALFRVLGLSATPGSDRKAINEVLGNLMIAKLEVRLDSDEDVKR